MIDQSLKFNFITNGIVHDITSTDSKYFHAHLLGCKNLTFQHFTITAHDESLNTDGIHIGRSKDIKIIDSDIGTGDDCISLGHGSRQITIEGVTCAPGHGISIGSLGKSQNEESVSGIFVKNCTISNTQNGVRIKSWPALFGGSASDIHFEDIIMKNVSNPIVIDQVYCPWNECNRKVLINLLITERKKSLKTKDTNRILSYMVFHFLLTVCIKSKHQECELQEYKRHI